MGVDHHHKSKSALIDSVLKSARFGIASYAPIYDQKEEITDFEIMYTNWEVPANFGLTPEEVIGKTCRQVYPGIFENGVFNKMKAAIETGNPDAYEIEVEVKGESMWLAASIEVVDGLVNMTSKNVTAEKQAALHLENMNKVLARKNEELASFAYIASHDLQEPLRKIMMFTSRILEKEKNFNPQTLNFFASITATAERMQNLIRDLLSFSRLDTESQPMEKTDLGELLDEAAAVLDEPLDMEISGTLPTLKAVPSQISQLFTNILDNAAKYRKADVEPQVKVRVEMAHVNHKKYWKIAISDNGIGFDPQYKEKIFEVFQRLHGKQEYSGTGVGLSICKKIMDNHNGFIEADGKPGEGAKFTMYFPQK
ncbi:MAG TPA: ATP-binding protein [Flavobacterium sp.]|jgi:PAS domain S-box-containing protein